jgi:hypothetical protein
MSVNIPQNMKKIVLLLLLSCSVMLFGQGRENNNSRITNVYHELDGNTIKIFYDMMGSKNMNIRVYITDNKGNPLKAASLTGATGPNIIPGKDKMVVWDMKNDGYEFTEEDIKVKVDGDVVLTKMQGVPYKISEGFRIGVGLGIGLPIGVTRNSFTSALGGGIQAKYILDGGVGIGVVFSYNVLALRNPKIGEIITYTNYGGLLEYYLNRTGNVSPYFGCEVSYYAFTSNIVSTIVNGSQSISFLSGLGFAPHIGIVYHLNDFVESNVIFKYNHVFSEGFSTQLVSISAGLVFKISSR